MRRPAGGLCDGAFQTPVVGLIRLVSLLAGVASCGGGTPEARNPDRPLPPYIGHATELFDDGIEPPAVGFPMDASGSPQTDTRVRERTQTGDAVVRARVRTVTSKAEDRGLSWQLGLHVVERVGGTGPLETDFTLPVLASDPAAGIVRAFEARLIGKTFIVFVREFSHAGAPQGDPGDLRFHVAADSADELKAVKAALLLDAVH
jgi:hypothetical protein